jgi:dTDP-4-dehydrorhamnose reductase
MDKIKKILITGCGGMLGKAVYETFNKEFRVLATDIDINEPWLKYLDVRRYDMVKKAVEQFRPDIIFHLAALTDLEFQEKNPDESYKTNALGTENIVLIAKEHDIPVLYISTAGIVDGKKDLYDDFDTPNPISTYGKSKYYGELFVKEHLKKYFILRAGWMMGGGKKDKKFVYKIIKQIKEGKTVLDVVENIYGTPTYTYDFAKVMKEIIKTKYYGGYNTVCGGGRVSRYDVALEIIRILGLKDKIRVNKVYSDFFASDFFAPRPRSEALINKKLNIRGLNKMRDWRDCLAEYIDKEFKDLKENNIHDIFHE